ncbi:MAG: hypothetical protein ACE5KH_00505 [Candidatus Geothermarchaeales archaeon]
MRIAKITAWVGVVFVVGAIVAFMAEFDLFYGPQAVFPVPGHSRYYAILGDFNLELEERKIGVGDAVAITFPFDSESLNGYHAFDAVFSAELTSEQIAKGLGEVQWWAENRSRTWESYVSGGMEHFDISVEIPVSDDQRLAGESISGTLGIDVLYPAETSGGAGFIPGSL